VKRATLIACLVLGIACGKLALAANDPQAIWIDVPYVAQAKEGCGSAAISMVMQYWAKQKGQNASAQMDAAKIQEALYSPKQQGIPASAMEKYFQEHGYRAFVFRGDWGDLQNHVSKGRPLIVSLGPNGATGPLHYAVVVGVDEARGYLFLNDPARGKMLRMSREGFQTEWDLGKRWTLLAVPAGER
jgi:ABC-type bacteriocin/lantibiotic exporter with double-glycine peptidase domain